MVRWNIQKVAHRCTEVSFCFILDRNWIMPTYNQWSSEGLVLPGLFLVEKLVWQWAIGMWVRSSDCTLEQTQSANSQTIRAKVLNAERLFVVFTGAWFIWNQLKPRSTLSLSRVHILWDSSITCIIDSFCQRAKFVLYRVGREHSGAISVSDSISLSLKFIDYTLLISTKKYSYKPTYCKTIYI